MSLLQLEKYRITEQINAGQNALIYRGFRNNDSHKVVVKILRNEYPTLEQISSLRQEYKITQTLKNTEGIVKSLDLEKYQRSYALVLEDVTGKSLKQLLAEEKLKLREILRIFIKLAETLGEIHQIPVIHKDLKPSNIIVNNETGQVKLTDFGIASQLSKETPTAGSSNFVEGTLAYMSPEQTGRMNRAIDYRSDYYSLGATLYESLTARLPFSTREPMELVHCHLAINPKPPREVNPEIPETLSEIVMKLLAKNAEERYQSAEGLKYDLEKCFQQLTNEGNIEYFLPGERDRGTQLSIPEKLYGREKEVRRLLAAFDRVSGVLAFDPPPAPLEKGGAIGARRTGILPVDEGVDETDEGGFLRSEMILVSGYSGIGKTAIVNEVHKPIVRQRGYFINGKFDQFKRNIPYAAVVQAFSELVLQLLVESSQKVEIWKQKILKAVGANGRVIIDVIPELEFIVGPQPEVPQLGPTESQNRFNRVFQQFVSVFTREEHPLVVFLDDLQWADSASLKLIELLITNPESKYLLLIGAYRDNEVSPTHPTIQTIEKIKASGAPVNNIVVKPLELSHVSQLVAETLGEKPPQTTNGRYPERKAQQASKPLAELIYQKTQGNPFFITQLLKSLYSEQLLAYRASTDSWEWNLEEIQAVGITDYNVVELVARNIEKLSEFTQKALKLAACIGNQFNLKVLSIANQESETVTAAQLWEALQAGLILPKSKTYKIPLSLGGQEETGEDLFIGLRLTPSPTSPLHTTAPDLNIEYRFLHDRVQQAAYSLIPDSHKQQAHLHIGRLLLANTTEEERQENIFPLVNQLNYGIDLLANRGEKRELAELNLIAGEKAKASAAYEAALNYLNVAMGMLDADSWERDYELARDIYVGAIEAEYLNSNYERSDELVEVALAKVKTLLEKVNVYEIKIKSYVAQNQLQKAIELGLKVVEMLGVSLEKEAPKIEEEIEELANLPEMTDGNKLAVLRILDAISSAIFTTNSELALPVTFTQVNLCINYGNSAIASKIYVSYGTLLCGLMDDISQAHQFGKLGVAILDRRDVREFRSTVFEIFSGHIQHWKEPIQATLEPLQEAFFSGLETGELLYSGYAALVYCSNLFSTGEHLETVEEKQREYLNALQKLKLEYHVGYGVIGRQLSLNLLNRAPDKLKLVGEAFNESETLPILIEYNIGTALVYAYLAKAMLAYLFKEPKLAAACAREGAKYEQTAAGLLTVAENNFYYSLALLADYPNVSETEQQQYLSELEANQAKMKHWAEHAPANFQHKYDLVEAETARVFGDRLTAINCYESALNGVRQQGFTHEEALINELAGEYHLQHGQKHIGRFYIVEAYYCYIRWGAVAKVKDLEERYSSFLHKIKLPQIPSGIDVTITNTSTTNSSASSHILDLPAVMQASQAISGELELEKLQENLIKIVVENAGATSGVLMLLQEGKLLVEAVAKVEKNGTKRGPDKYIVRVMNSTPVEESKDISPTALNYVLRTQKSLVVTDAFKEPKFTNELYVKQHQIKSILCVPILKQGALLGVIYLENNLATGAFTKDRVQLLKLLCSQAAVSLENARLYRVSQDYSQQLERSLQELKNTQLQLVQSEKMSAIGQLMAGIAHEINNPVGFIAGNVEYAQDYARDLIELVELYQQNYPEPASDISEKIEEVELDYLVEDFPEIIASMKTGTDRIRDISTSLRTFSRADAVQKSEFDLHEGIDSTLLILKHRLKDNETRPAIEIVKQYGDLPAVFCYPGQLSQVFMNLMANAIDAFDEFNQGRSYQEIKANPNIITIVTEARDNSAVVRIKDNGMGMSEEVRQKLFEYLFTTKPAGKGTGLGLSISHQIVEDKHGGKLSVISAPGQGAEFIIEIPIEETDSK
jgi:predicted ATPase/signal transduction histidine kinase/tRNA A-37 threonylcarbamoyl transferase component Bud32